MSGPTIAVHHGRHSFRVTDYHREFWESVNTGDWERETFRLLDHCITPDTVHVDIGAWIGPTLLYAAGVARLSLGFEPDPAAFRALQANVALNPSLRPVRLHPVAVAARSGRSQMGSRSAPGDSMSSMLFADSSSSWPVELRRIDEFEGEIPAGSPVFLKIDIEGGEYELLPALHGFLSRHHPTVYLSLHPHFFMAAYLGRGRLRQAWGELKLLARTLRAWWPVYRRYAHIYHPAGGRLSAWSLLRRRHWRCGLGLVLSPEPIPYLESAAG